MKTWSILILALALGACATPATMEELEAEAWLTGDWSEVERREDIELRRAARRVAEQGPQCATGYTAYCVKQFGERQCTCMSRRMVDNVLGRGLRNY